MKNINNIFWCMILILCVSILESCNEKQANSAPSKPPVIPKENAVEYVAKTSRTSDGKVVVQTTKTIYENKLVAKMDVLFDTLPSLGTEKIQDEDDDGNKIDTTVNKEYDILFKIDQ